VTSDVQVERNLDTPSNPLLMNNCLRRVVKWANSTGFGAAGTLLTMAYGIFSSRERLCNLDVSGAQREKQQSSYLHDWWNFVGRACPNWSWP
jgi:hypothetical protein